MMPMTMTMLIDYNDDDVNHGDDEDIKTKGIKTIMMMMI